MEENQPKKRRSIKDFASYSENVFKPVGITMEFRKAKGKDRLFQDVDNGDYVALRQADKGFEVPVDNLPFVKMFQAGLIKTGELSVPAFRLLLYIMYTIKPNKDSIIINIDDFLDTFGYAKAEPREDGSLPQRNTVHYYRAAAELLEQEYICKKQHTEHGFFINVNKFFNGNRIKL